MSEPWKWNFYFKSDILWILLLLLLLSAIYVYLYIWPPITISRKAQWQDGCIIIAIVVFCTEASASHSYVKTVT